MYGSRGRVIIVATLLAMPAAAHAEVSGSIDLVSDYRFRGISLSGNRPALQGTLHVEKGGLFAEGFVTTLGRSDGKAPVETDVSFGFTHDIGKGTATLSGTWYLYPGGRHQPGVFEIVGRYDHPIGKATVSVNAGYAPPQNSLRGSGNLYLGLSATVPVGRPELFASVGRERGALFGSGTKLDWQLGAQMKVAGFNASLSYVDSDRTIRDSRGRDMSRATVLVSVGHAF
jgi:uncharacterized protein (TIGR02001 family)